MIRLVSKSVLISIAAVAVMGCWASVDRQPSRFTPAPSGHESAVLRVSANAVPWSSHRLGEGVSRELVSVGTLKTVHYPIEPRNPPPLRIEIVASGEVNEHYVWGTFASILGGASLGLLLPVLPFFEDLDLSSEVTIVGHEIGQGVFRRSGRPDEAGVGPTVERDRALPAVEIAGDAGVLQQGVGGRRGQGVLEFLPGLGLLFFDTDLAPLFAPVERADALLDVETPPLRIKLGVDYITVPS